MAATTVIGAGAFVRGNVRGEGDLEIEGRVEGDVRVTGTVTVQRGALVKASLHGERVVVRGPVAGDLSADRAVLLEEGARVVGQVRAPSIAIGEGALVRGRVETGAAGEASVPAAREGGAATRGATAAKSTATAARPTATATAARPTATATATAVRATAARPATPATAARPAPPAAIARPYQETRAAAPIRSAEGEANGRADHAGAARGAAATNEREASTEAESSGPPAPVVPSLKRGAKGALKKKAGA